MKIKLLSLLTLILISLNSFSQEKTVTLQGKINSPDKINVNVLIFNITKNIGAISNEFGEFKLYASANDTLYISSIQYEKSKVIVTKKILKQNKLL
jgi:hypothetical protein